MNTTTRRGEPPAAGVRTIRAIGSRGRSGRRRQLRSRDRRGVSDVVGTILLLALTVTLFSSIFLFVDTFPQPPAQPSTQFAANLLYGGAHGQSIVGLNIEHLAGPTLAGTIDVYLSSADHPTRFPTPFTLAQGLNGSTSWNLGQLYYLNLTTYSLTAPDNITVSIVSTTQLLFRVTLPGQNPTLPPQFVAQGTVPTVPTVGQSFLVYVQIVDPVLKTYSVFANVSELPGVGVGALQKMTYSSTTGLFTVTLTDGVSQSGSYYIFVNASDNKSQTNSIALPVTITTATTPPSTVSLSVSPEPPVNGSAATIYALVSVTGTAAGTVNATFYAGASLLGTVSGTVSAGSSVTLSESWTPTAVGIVDLKVSATTPGEGTPSGSLNVTVFPTVLFVAHNVVAGTQLANNTSAYLEQELRAAGFPFTPMFVACGSSLPAASTYETYNVVVIDFGSQATGTCTTEDTSTVQGTFTSAMTSSARTNFFLVGSSLTTSTACSSYSSTFLTDFGITTGTTCTASETQATSTVTYTANTGQDLLADGIGALTLNKTLAGSSATIPYFVFHNGASGGFLSTSSGTFGSFGHASGAGRGVVIAADPAQFMTTLPAPTSQAWGLAAGGTQVVFNVMNYVSHLSSSTSPGRALPDFAISGVTLVGQSASHLTSIYVTTRGNGPLGGLVQVTLTVNGTIGLFGGAAVTATVTVLPNGQNTTTVLTWDAPAPGPYTLGVVGETLTGNLWGTLSQYSLSIINKPFVFTT